MVLSNGLFPRNSERWDDEFESSVIKNRGNFYYVGGDYTYGVQMNTMNESTIATVTIPANTIVNGITMRTVVSVENNEGAGAGGTFRIKAGTAGSEVERVLGFVTGAFPLIAYGEREEIWSSYSNLDWKKEQTVIVTVVLWAASMNLKGFCWQLEVIGF